MQRLGAEFSNRIDQVESAALREIAMNRQISAVMVWRSGVIGTSNAVRKYCANTIAFDALNLFRVSKLYTRPEVQGARTT